MVLFLSGYDLSEPSIGLGGLVPPSLPTHHHIPTLPFSELELIFFSGYERFEPTIGLGGLATAPLRPTSTIPPPSFSEFVIYFFFRLGLLNLPSVWDLFSQKSGPSTASSLPTSKDVSIPSRVSFWVG